MGKTVVFAGNSWDLYTICIGDAVVKQNVVLGENI